MSPLETKQDGRNVHLLIQVEDGRQYVVADHHFKQNKVHHAYMKWFELKPDRAAARVVTMASPAIQPDDYVVYNARGLTPQPNYFAVWFVTVDQFDECCVRLQKAVVPADQVENITPRKQAALAWIRSKAAELYAARFEQQAA